MPQNEVERTTGQTWDFLEPAIDPNSARTIHGKIIAAGAGLFVAYPAGQSVGQKSDGTNVWAKDGVATHTDGPFRLIKYPVVVNEDGYWQHGDTWVVGQPTHEGSVEMYYQGKFKVQDVTSADKTMLGRLISGTYVTGIFELGYVAPPAAP